MINVPFQEEFRPLIPRVPNVYGAKDYRDYRDILIKIHEILRKGNLEEALIREAIEHDLGLSDTEKEAFYHSQKFSSFYQRCRYALRCNIARHLTGESYRAFSIRLVDSHLFQWFTDIHDMTSRKAISKSSLERAEKLFDEALIADKIRTWMAGLSNPEKAQACGLSQAIDTSDTWMDSTCLKADIHFPVDWVLLRDAARSLLLAIKAIRQQGLKNRMIEPSILMKEMNKLCIQMTNTRRKKDSKKHRKSILRVIKQLIRRIEKHANRYRTLLLKALGKTAWSEAQMQQVIRRLDQILEQLPAAIQQAHDRIIGERVIASKDKILSLYDQDAHVIVRGKSGSEVEFGQGFLLTEQREGLIIDWELLKDQPPSDSQLLQPALKRLVTCYGPIRSVCADRGFWSKKNEAFLKEENITNAICPRSPQQLQEKLSDSVFSSSQTRRSQTEGRIGIFKNVFLGKPLRSRITVNKRHAINWCVLSHNLWVLARITLFDERAAQAV